MQDQKYLEPMPIDEFREKNRTYITDKLEKISVDEHWEMMLDEILAEVEAGRMNGPYQAPGLVAGAFGGPCERSTSHPVALTSPRPLHCNGLQHRTHRQ